MWTIGLTGNIACGKSTVARRLAQLGASVIDADAIVKELYADPAFAARVAALFATEVRRPDGTVDHGALARIVFADPAALKRLEALVHPAVAARRDEILAGLNRQNPPPAVVLEAVKLVESGQAAGCDVVWCVVCRTETQWRRLMEQRGLTLEQARERLARQPSLEGKQALLGGVPLVLIHNDGTLEELERQVANQWTKLGDLKATAKRQAP